MKHVPNVTMITLLFAQLTVLQAAEPSPPEGFRAIFDGKDLTGWHGLNPHSVAKLTGEKKEASLEQQRADFPKHWSVENGELVNDGHGPYATSDEEFGDIEFLLEYKTVPKADSGIYLRGTPQVQIWDWNQVFDPKNPNRKPHLGSGGLFNNTPGAPGRDPLVLGDKPFGEWNKFRIRLIGDRTWVWLNDKLVVDGSVMENYWDRSKPLPAKGPIMLQTHGGEIRWRNLFVRDIDPDQPTIRIEKDETVKGEVVKYARFKVNATTSFGILEGDNVREISGSIFGTWKKTDKVHALSDVTLLVPTRPRHVFAMAGNYKSHLGNAEILPKFRIPQPFFKSPSSLLRHEGRIIIPKDSTGRVHYEAEMVIVIGSRAHRVSYENALDYVLGVTCGNDVSERYWQNDEENKDVQWWRAKSSDTFGPCGPFIVSGLNYDDLLLTLRLNGEVKQQGRTSQMIHDVSTQVSFISNHVTLLPGDLIFTGTSGKTTALHPKDMVEVELEGVGVLRNHVGRQRKAKSPKPRANRG